MARRLSLEPVFLEDRTLLSFSLAQVTQAYDQGAAAIGTAAGAASIVDQVLGVNALPLANQTLDNGLGIAADFLRPFQTVLTQGTADWTNTVEPELIAAGFSVPVPFTGTPDRDNNLLEVTWAQTLDPTDPIKILGQTGLSYLDGAGGGLFGGITATGSVAVTLTFGVDVNPASQQIGFFVAPASNVVQASLSGSTANGGLSGTLNIGDLANVSATATGSVAFNGTLNLQATAADSDGKLRTADLTNSLSQAVTGGVSGSATINVSQFDAQLFGLPDITWSGVITKSIVGNVIQPESDSVQGPSPSAFLSSLGASLFSLGDGIPVLGSLSNTVNKPLPLIGESIAQLTGLNNHIPSLPPLPSGFSLLQPGSYPLAGGTLTLNVTPDTIKEFIKGQDVSLVSWESQSPSGGIDLVDENITVPIFALGIPDIASVELDATFGVHASLEYHVGFGLDGHGFYALAGTPTLPTLGMSFAVTAGVQGQVEVFGLPLAEAGGDIGFSVTPYVTLTPAPTSVDPSSDPTKVYMSDLALFGKDPLTDLVDDLSAGIEGDFTGDLYAKINLLFFSKSWNWGINIPVFNFERSPTWPILPVGSGPSLAPWPNAIQVGTVVTFNTTSTAAENVTLAQMPGGGGLTVGWAGAPSGYATSENFPGATSFIFNGGAGDDTLTAEPGLTTTVRAVGGSGNDTFDFRNSSANNTLIAGTGQNNLYGGTGNDLLIGGNGNDTLTTGSGTDTLYGGSGSAIVNLGSGKDSFYGGSGTYQISGDTNAGDKPTYMIDGGTGTGDVINAGLGSHDTIYGGSGGANTLTGGAGGYDMIYGGGAGDSITGGGGYDTIYGSGGSVPGSITNSKIMGGPLGDNTIFGGGGGDTLAGGLGSGNTVWAGTGNETLAGGDAKDLVVNPQGNGLDIAEGDFLSSGSNTLIAGSGNDTLYGDTTGHNLLQAGPENDTLYAGSGGDTMIAGLGIDALYGSVGDDTFQLPFIPVGSSQPNDTLVGGGGSDILVLKAESGTGAAKLNVNSSPIPDATTTSVTVSNGLVVAADLPSNGTGLAIQIDSEQMLVTAVNGNVLTVERGYGGTTASAHGSATVALAPPTFTSSPIADATTTSVTVSNGLAVAADLPANGGGLVIQIGTEQMLVTAVTGNVLTVVRGYGGTTASAHASTTVVLAPTSLTASAIVDTTTTFVTVSNGPAVAADLPSDGTGLLIQIGNEQMLVTAVTGNVLTVQRAYNDTTAATHGDNALVLLPDTLAPQPEAAPSDYQLYLNQGASADQYVATLSTLRFATTASGSTTVTGIDSTTGLAVGEAVTGPGLPAGTTVAAISSSTSIILSSAAGLSKGDLPLTFGTVGGITLSFTGYINNIQLEGGPGENLIQVDPSVTRDVTIYGGPGAYNVLMAGSGNDTLIAGPGTAVLYGGTGNDTLYGGDIPTQDVAPTMGTYLTAPTVTQNASPVDGNDTLIAGPGNDELVAGNGNDLLIGGSVARLVNSVTGTPGVALLQNGQYQLIEGAGQDVLTGGAGNDVLIAGPGGSGAVLQAGTGYNTLITQNYGVNILSGGDGTRGSLLLGGNLENFEISNSATGGGNTLVGGLGIDNLQAGAGTDVLYASYNEAAWSQGEAAAAADGVHVVPPQLFQGDSNASQLQTLLEDQQTAPLTQDQRKHLLGLLNGEFTPLATEEAVLNTQVEYDLNNLDLSESPTLKTELIAVATQDEFVQTELTALLNQILKALDVGSFLEDQLIGGSGTGAFYGNIQGATHMVGGTGVNTFYNYNASDLVQGSGAANTLVLQDYQGNNTITLSQDTDPSESSAAIFSVNGDQLLVGDTGNTIGIQTLAIQLGSGNDTLTVNLPALPSSSGLVKLTSLEILCGTGNDLVDASAFNGNRTITGGAGNDIIKVGAINGGTSDLTGTPTTELDLELENGSGNNSVTVNGSSLQINSFTQNLSDFVTFGKLVVVGGAGSNSFSVSGIPNVLLVGGSGANSFSVTGGTATLIGGSGSNSFTLIGPGNYTVNGGSGASTTNALTFYSNDTTPNDSLVLSQIGSTVTFTGTVSNSSVGVTATNLSSLFVNCGSGDADSIDASRTTMGVTLNMNGGGGSSDILKGGDGNDTLYYSGPNGSYDGDGGTDNLLVFQDTNGDSISVFPSYLLDVTSGSSYPLTGLTRTEYIEVRGSLDHPLQIWTVDLPLSISLAFDGGSDPTSADSVAVQPDGKILVAGVEQYAGNGDYYDTLYRFNSDGTPDTTFAGSAASFDPSQAPSGTDSVAVQPQTDGTFKIIVAGGEYYQNGDYYKTLFRFNSDGTLDTDFADGGGVSFDPSVEPSVTNSVAVQVAHGISYILVAGSEYSANGDYYEVLYRFDAGGNLDTSFDNGDGGFAFDPSATASSADSVAVQPDGRILVAGVEQYAGNGDFYQTLYRFNSDGTPDTTFAGSAASFDPSQAPSGTDSVAVQPQTDGTFKIIVAGGEYYQNGDYYKTLFRFNSDGTLDTDFADGGGVSFDPSVEPSVSNSVAVLSDGSFVVAGSDLAPNGDYFQTLDRFNAGGTSDTGFDGGGGFAFDPSATSSGADSVVVQPLDGKILVIGSLLSTDGSYDQTLYRFNGDGTLDQTFSGVSTQIVNSGPLTTTLTASLTDTDSNAGVTTDSATVAWGDQTTSTAAIMAIGGAALSSTASHVYATNGIHQITLTIIDSLGAAAAGSTSFTGGLALENGKLISYIGSTPTLIDSGVEAYVVRNADSTVFSIHTNGDLLAFSGSSSQMVPGEFLSIATGPDGNDYGLLAGGYLGVLSPGSVNPVIIDSGVRAIVSDTSGDFYELYTDGSLSVMPVGSTTYISALANVKSVSPSNGGVNVLTNAGGDWQFMGASGTLIGGPHLALTVAPFSASITAATWASNVATITTSAPMPTGFSAGQSVAILGMTPAGYNGVFTITSVVSSTQLTYALTSDPGAATAFGSAATAPASAPITAASWGFDVATASNLATITTSAPLPAGFSAGQSVQVSGMTPAGYNGIFIVASVVTSNQFTYALTTDPGVATAFGSAASAIAGGDLNVTLTILDVFNNPVVGYTGTVTFGDSDAPAVAAGYGPPLAHTFTAADNGSFSFPAAFLTSGGQTLTAAESNTVTAATWASGVVTFSGAVALPANFAVGQNVTISGMTPTSYNGTFTVLSVVNGTQFTVALPADPGGPATALGTVIYYGGLRASTTLAVSAGAAVQFSVDPPTAVVNTASSITVTVYDVYGNIATGYTGPVKLTSVIGAAASPITNNAPSSPGTYDFSPTFSKVGGQKLVATGGNLAGDGAIIVTPALYDLTQSYVSATPNLVAAGDPIAVTLTARDAQGNQETSGGLIVQFSFSGTTAGTFSATVDNGDGTYTALFNTVAFPGLDNFTAMIDGTSVLSNPASVTIEKATPTITWATPANITYGTALGPAQFDPTSSVPGAFNYTPAVGTLLGAGTDQTVSTMFTPTDNTVYNIAAATVALKVVPAAPLLSINPVSFTYGAALANSQLSGTATWTVGGTPVTVPGSFAYTIASGVVPGAGTGQTESVTFTPTDSTDYRPVTTTVTVNVAPASLTVTADNQTKVYGKALPILTASYSGFVNGDTVASLTVPPTLTTTATATSDVSNIPYAITASGAVDSNYTIQYAQGTLNGKLTIEPAPLTITAANANMIAGQSVPSFDVSYIGFVLGQGPSVLGGTLAISTPAISFSPAGSYPIIPAGRSSTNYAITYVDGTLVVAAPPIPLVTVTDVYWSTEKLSRKKSIKVLDVAFSGPLDPANVNNAGAFVLDTATRSKKLGTRYNKAFPFKTASYNSGTNTVTLTPRKTIPSQTMQLTINASLVLDAEGRPLDGNNDGQPGGNYARLLNGHGVIGAAVSSIWAGGVSASAIDAMMVDGSIPSVGEKATGLRRGSR